jgi:hypothetical protein
MEITVEYLMTSANQYEFTADPVRFNGELIYHLQRNAGADRQLQILAWTRAAPVAVGKTR